VAAGVAAAVGAAAAEVAAVADPTALHGLGIGWRPALAHAIERLPFIDFIELTAELVPTDRDALTAIDRLRERGVAVAIHGLGLSLGSAESVDPGRLRLLRRVAHRFDAAIISEHLGFVRAGGLDAGHFLPLPRTRDAVDVVVANVREAQERLGQRIALENIASPLTWPDTDLDEAEFVSEIVEQSDSQLLLDVANLASNARNHALDVPSLLRRLPLHRLAYVHVAGGTTGPDGIHRDTHLHAVEQHSLSALRDLAQLTDIPAVMLERDGRFPTHGDLDQELHAIATASGISLARA
jgi:uncharacterized protein (UPF0276 family)